VLLGCADVFYLRPGRDTVWRGGVLMLVYVGLPRFGGTSFSVIDCLVNSSPVDQLGLRGCRVICPYTLKSDVNYPI